MNLKNRITQTFQFAAGMTLLTALCTSSAYAHEEPEKEKAVQWGYNALQSAGAYTASAISSRTRLHTNLDLQFNLNSNQYEIGYHGINQVDLGLAGLTYFTRSVITAAINQVPVQLATIVLANDGGILDVKGGIRNSSLVQMIGDYGFIDVGANHNGVKMDVLYGKVRGPFAADLFHSTDVGYSGAVRTHTELQVSKLLGEEVKAFARVECDNFNLAGGTYMVGVEVRIR